MDDRTLTERVGRLEQFLGLGGEDVMRDEGDKTTQRRREDHLSDGAVLGVAGRGTNAQSSISRKPPPGKTCFDVFYDKSLGDDKTERNTSFEEIIQRVQMSTDRILHGEGKLKKIGDRILGVLPEGAERDGEEARGPNGTLEHAITALNILDGAIQRLEIAAARLEHV